MIWKPLAARGACPQEALLNEEQCNEPVLWLKI